MSAHHEHAYALATSVTLYVVGKFSTVILFVLHLHVPPVIGEVAQIFCYVGGGMAGFISAYLFWDKRVKPYLLEKKKLTQKRK